MRFFASTAFAVTAVAVAACSSSATDTSATPVKIDDADLKKWLEDKLDGTHAEWDAPDADTMYVIYFPATTTYTLDAWTGCVEFGASDNMLVTKDGRCTPTISPPSKARSPSSTSASIA